MKSAPKTSRRSARRFLRLAIPPSASWGRDQPWTRRDASNPPCSPDLRRSTDAGCWPTGKTAPRSTSMALLDWIAADQDLRLEGARVRLRPHRSSDYSEWAALREASRAFLQPWEPTWPVDDLTRTAYRRRLAAYVQDI